MNYNESKGLVQLPVLYNAANAAENKNGVGEAIRQVKLSQVGGLHFTNKV
jgi:hypothetical protein